LVIRTIKKKAEQELTQEDYGWAMKEADGWKFLLPSIPKNPQSIRAVTAFQMKVRGVLTKVTEEINDGTLKSETEAQAAYSKYLSAYLPAFDRG